MAPATGQGRDRRGRAGARIAGASWEEIECDARTENHLVATERSRNVVYY
jgi:hypothetical protein